MILLSTTFILYLVIKELSANYRSRRTFARGFKHGIEAATPIFEKMKYRIDLAAEADATDVTLYIRGRMNHPCDSQQ